MKWLFAAMWALGCLSLMATYGADNPKQKKIYACITAIVWIATLVLANALL